METTKISSSASQVTEKQFGINRIYRFSAKKGNSDNWLTTTEDIVNLEKKLQVTVLKMEFTNKNCFLLLSDGRVFSKGGEDCLGRANDTDSSKSKKFAEVNFIEQTNNEEEKDKSAIIYNISAGDEHVLALDNHYNVWAWGKNDFLQISPKLSTEDVKFPTKLTLPSGVAVVQVFALLRSSMIISRHNKILMWGSVGEGFLGDLKEKNFDYVKDYLSMDLITACVANEINKNADNFTEVFINSRKLFNTKYNKTLEDNYNKKNRIEQYESQIANLKKEIELRTKQNNKKMDSFSKSSNEKANKNVTTLKDLLRVYEMKLDKISKKKDNLRKELISIEEELKQKSLDLDGSTKQIDSVEDNIEKCNNEMTKLRNSLENEKNKFTRIKDIEDKDKMLHNLKIYKESLMNNIQVIIQFIEEKEKERKRITSEIEKQSEKESNYLDSRYTVEDMIMIIIEAGENPSEKEQKKNSTTEKFKEKYEELFSISHKLDKITFTELDKISPFKIISDLVELSNSKLEVIKTTVERLKSTLTEIEKDNVRVMINMVETKINLVQEQNTMIINLYNLFTNLEPEIKKKYTLDFKNTNEGNYDSHIEYVYKERIKEFLEEANKSGKSRNSILTIEEKTKLEMEKNEYIKEKQKNVAKLMERNKMFEDLDTNFNLDNFESLKDESKPKKSGSMFSWMGF